MVRVFSHYVSAKLVLLVVLEALVLALAVRLGLASQFSGSGAATVVSGIAAPPPAAAFSLGMLIVMNSMGLYRPDVWKDEQSILGRSVAALLIGLGLTFLMMYLVSSLYLGPGGLAVTMIVALAGTGLVRFAYYKLDTLAAFKRRVLVLGTGSRAMQFAEAVRLNQDHMIVGYVALPPSTHHCVPLPHVLPKMPEESLWSVVEKHRIDQIVIAVRDRRAGGLPVHDLLECRLRGVKVTELPTFFEREYRQVLLESLNATWIMLGEGFRRGIIRTSVKRLFDLAASAMLLLFALPVMLVAAGCIFLESGLPVLFRQERIGKGGRVFTIYKLRSMKNDAESDGTPRWTVANDDRTTRVGRIIRRLRIDELPQIFNVLKGDMSFVGPRPERLFFVDELAKQIPYYSVRHSVKPGITGWAQVRYRYGASLDDAIEKLQYDLYYAKNHTLFLDLVILIATVEVVLWGRGAR
jgi:sugar transferase (PEP-CTERM system associated)